MATGVNVLVRGQSNALLFVENGGAEALRAGLEQQLGRPVNLIAGWGDDTSTIHSATRFMTWDTEGQQQSLIGAIAEQPQEARAAPTAVLWLHNEYDQQGSFSADEWEAEVRADAGLVRGALGQDAASVPYVFAPVKYPYGGNFGAIQEGMERLSADESFNASMTWDATALRMDGGPEAGEGSSHMGRQDAQDLGRALVDDVAAALDGAAAPAPVPSPSTPSPQPEAPVAENAFDVVLQDDFSQGYKTENWGQPFNGGTYWNGAWSWSGSDVNVRDGAMEVTMTRHDDGWWTGGGFNSFKAGHAITYGKFEFDGRVDEGKGTMGVFLTWPASDQWPVDGEIDILETPGEDVMHTTHWQDAEGGWHGYDSVRNQAYDETQWQHYDVLWLPDYLGIKVGDQVVAEWTDPAMIPDVAHGLGAMGNVASPNDGWMGPPPDGSTPSVVRAQMDNVVMRQWNGAEVDIEAWKNGTAPSNPAPTPTQPAPTPTQPTQPAPGPLTGGSGPDHLQLWVSEDAYQGDAQFVVKVDGAQVGGTFTATHEHGRSAQAVDLYGDWAAGPHEVEVEFVNDKWDGTEATDRNLYVNGALINGEAIVGAEQAVLSGSVKFGFEDKTGPAEGPATPAPVDPEPGPVDPEPEQPEEPAPEPEPEPTDPVEPAPEPEPEPTEPAGFVEVSGGGGRDTLRLDGAFSFRVDGGAGKDVVVLGGEHGASVVVMAAGEAKGDLVLGFEPGMDALEFRGFGEGAKVEALGDERFRVSGADAKAETFVLAGVEQLDPTDYLFA